MEVYDSDSRVLWNVAVQKKLECTQMHVMFPKVSVSKAIGYGAVRLLPYYREMENAM